MLKSIAVAVVVASLAAPIPSTAHEADWLYFPMYERDTAHAVHLKALRFRPDGLLESGTRYPRVGESSWTVEESRQGWYDYFPRLVDCETGVFIDTGVSLLDQNGKTIAARRSSREEQIEQLTRQLRELRNHLWPDNSETLLACAAASSPTLQPERARRARVVPPLISFAPITQDLKADSDALLLSVRRRYDLDAMGRSKPSTARAVFEQLQSQHLQWRRRITGPGATAPGLAPPQLAAVQARLDTLGEREQVQPADRIRLLPRSAVQYQSEASVKPAALTPVQAARVDSAQEISETVLADCDSGLQIPVAHQWRDQEGKVLLERPVQAALALAQARQQVESIERGEGWDLRSGGRPDGTRVGAICGLVGRLAGDIPPGRAAAEPAASDLAEYLELNAEKLVGGSTPEAILLNVRAAIRAYRP